MLLDGVERVERSRSSKAHIDRCWDSWQRMQGRTLFPRHSPRPPRLFPLRLYCTEFAPALLTSHAGPSCRHCDTPSYDFRSVQPQCSAEAVLKLFLSLLFYDQNRPETAGPLVSPPRRTRSARETDSPLRGLYRAWGLTSMTSIVDPAHVFEKPDFCSSKRPMRSNLRFSP